MDKQIVQMKDVELMWPNLTEKSEMSDKYQCDLVNLTKKQVDLLEAAGLTVRDSKKEGKNEDKGKWITAKSKFPPRLYDGRNGHPKGTALPEGERVGNGSKAHVQLTAYDWDFNGKKGRNAGLDVLKITALTDSGGGDPFDSDSPSGDPF
jgi:hypothetical protein